MSSKRHSLFISTAGPRPLHLVDGNIQAPPTTAPLPSSKPFNHLHTPRRQSSISYNPRSTERDGPASASPLGPAARHVLARSASLGPKIPQKKPVPTTPVTSSSSPGELITAERPPLTLTEKHSELLHFIAQKESKCLELRSQLETHEAELLQLKRKWERIVNRGFERHTSGTENVSSTGVVLEGIKEGVHGVGRLIAAIGDTPAPTPIPTSVLPSPPTRPTHIPSPSSSSVSTFTTTNSKSTRFSQSSASSLGDEPLPMPSPAASASPHSKTPPSIPRSLTRAFAPDIDIDTSPLAVSPSTSLGAAKIHRRKSRDASALGLVPTPPGDDFPDSSKARRRSAGPSAFPPVSSIPGLGALTVGSAAPPVSSWVGKKWEELQRGSTFTKSQKRASTLLSDVSQSIASALSPPPASSSSSFSSQFPAAPACSLSLLDDDDGQGFATSPVMTPDLRPAPAQLVPALIPTLTPVRTTQPAGTVAPRSTPAPVLALEEEDEWNW